MSTRIGTLASAENGRPVVYALHENEDWWPPFEAAFAAAGVPVRQWLLVDGILDVDGIPPEGIFWSRISASSHTRDHVFSKDYARAVLAWLEAAGRRTVNGSGVLEIEVSKVRQLSALSAAGFDTPRTLTVIGRDGLLEAASAFDGPFITKHNQGGKGLGVRLFQTVSEFAEHLESAASRGEDQPADGITLLQEYVRPAGGFITRVEIVAGEFVYAIAADTVHGGFQLCPADACAVDPTTGAPIAPPGAEAAPLPGQSLFSLRHDTDPAFVASLVAFTVEHGIEIAGIEFIESADGRRVVYDINTNTNYNPAVEATAPRSGPGAIAAYLGSLLETAYPGSTAAAIGGAASTGDRAHHEIEEITV